MPMKSRAQRRKFAELLVKGEISEEVYERWNRETGRKELPERVTPKKKATPAKKATTAKKATSAKKATKARSTTKAKTLTRATKTTPGR